MDNILLLNLLEKVLGDSTPRDNGNYKFHCPSCNHSKKKLEININTEQWACWVCGTSHNFKGNKIISLFNKIKVQSHFIQELNKIIGNKRNFYNNNENKKKDIISLPQEFIPLTSASSKNIMAKHAYSYLKSRKITNIDIERYNIGFCEEGEYQNMIVIPSYDKNGNLNWFSTRTFNNSYIKTRNPSVSKDIIGFEYFINWNVPIIICEGAFDAITARKNAIPLFGKNISNELMKAIVQNNVPEIYIALDNDAFKDAIKHCETLLKFNKKVYLIELNKKDINDIGFEEFNILLQKTTPFTYKKHLELKFKT